MFIKCTTRNFSCERKKKEICVDAAKSGIHKDYVSFSVVLSFYSSLFCETSNIRKHSNIVRAKWKFLKESGKFLFESGVKKH